MKKKRIKETLICDMCDFLEDVSLKSAIAYLSGLRVDYSDKGYKDITIETDYSHMYRDDDKYYMLTGYREESDAEYEKRKKNLATITARKVKNKESQEKKERTTYERLKAKYGD